MLFIPKYLILFPNCYILNFVRNITIVKTKYKPVSASAFCTDLSQRTKKRLKFSVLKGYWEGRLLTTKIKLTSAIILGLMSSLICKSTHLKIICKVF